MNIDLGKTADVEDIIFPTMKYNGYLLPQDQISLDTTRKIAIGRISLNTHLVQINSSIYDNLEKPSVPFAI